MDCCNYMQYRHHQPYYGNHYYDPLPASPYHNDFYNHQAIYHQADYYGNTPYYNPSPSLQQWCTNANTNNSTFPSDYVYNPKEARLRKAMRDASRERTSIGASPMLPRPNVRRSSHSWISPQEDLLMGPMNIRNIEGSTLCGGGFPLQQTGNNHFITQMNPNYKMEHHQPPPSANYLQSNPLAQLQQHTEMWHEYQTIRPRSSSGNPFMMPDLSPYHSQTSDLGTNSMPASRRITSPTNLQRNATSPATASAPPPTHTNENIPPASLISAQSTSSIAATVPTENLLNKNQDFRGKLEANNDFIPVFEREPQRPQQQQEGSEQQQRFDKIEENLKKPLALQIHHNNTKKPVNSKPLPDFNEAFGSTERGRFQSPPDPRLAPNKGYLDYFFDTSPIKFDDYQI